MKKASIRLAPLASLRGLVGEGDLVAFNVGPDGDSPMLGKFDLCGLDGNPVPFNRIVGRGDSLYGLSGGDVYRIDVQTAVSGLIGA